MNRIFIKIAGVLNILTAVVHLVGGQVDLVRPLQQSNLLDQQKAEWLGVWHVVTFVLFYTSYVLLQMGFLGKGRALNMEWLRSVGYLYLLMGIAFVLSSINYGVLAPQWILLMPVGGLLLIGIRKIETQ